MVAEMMKDSDDVMFRLLERAAPTDQPMPEGAKRDCISIIETFRDLLVEHAPVMEPHDPFACECGVQFDDSHARHVARHLAFSTLTGMIAPAVQTAIDEYDDRLQEKIAKVSGRPKERLN